MNKQFGLGLLLGFAITVSVGAVHALSIVVEDISVKDLYFATAMIAYGGQGPDVECVERAWKTANIMMKRRQTR